MNSIPIHWRTQPFTGAVNTKVFAVDDGKRLSLAQMIEAIPPGQLPARFGIDGVVCLNGVEIPRAVWHRVYPKAKRDFDIAVTLHIPLHNGGGGGGGGQSKSPLATVAAIALLVVATAATAGVFGPVGALSLSGTYFAAGSTSATFLAAGIGVAGSLALAALAPPPQRSAASDSGFASSTSASADNKTPASVDGNVLSRGGPVPRPIGTHKIFPPLACEPLVELIGDDEYVEAVYVLSGPNAFDETKIGEAPIDQISDLTYEIGEALPSSAVLTLVTRQSHTDAPQLALSRPQADTVSTQNLLDQYTPASALPIWHPIATRQDPDEFWVQLAFQEGIADYASPATKMAIPVRLRFRRKGELVWVNAPEIHFCSSTGLALQKVIRVKWQVAPLTQPTAPTNEGPYLAYKSVPAQTLAPGRDGWEADSYFSAGSGSDVYSASTVGTHKVRNISLNRDGVEIFLDPATFPNDVYEFQIMAGGAYTAGSLTQSTYAYGGSVLDFFGYYTSGATLLLPRSRAQVHDKITIGRITSIWNETPLPLDVNGNQAFAFIALRAKNRRIDRLSTIASGYVKDWNGTDWGDYTTTSNPAPHYVDALCGSMNADPLPVDLLDNDVLVAWRAACASLDYTVDTIIEGGTVEDARALFAACGYARPRQSERWGVLRDKDRSADTPVQIFSSRNMSGFRWERAFPKLPDGFRVVFNNRDLDYQEDQIIVVRDGIDPLAADRIEEMRYAGLVETAKATTRAEFDLAQLTARSRFYYGSTDAEALVCESGDLVGLNHDVIAHWAGSARIETVTRSGDNVTSITLDSSVPAPGRDRFMAQPQTFLTPNTFLVGNDSGASIRCANGSVVTAQVNTDVSGDEQVTELTFTTPISDPAVASYTVNGESYDRLIVPGMLVTVGRLGQEFRRLAVANMAFGKDITADLTFVDEAPELWS